MTKWESVAHELARALQFKCDVHGYVQPERTALARYEEVAEASMHAYGPVPEPEGRIVIDDRFEGGCV